MFWSSCWLNVLYTLSSESAITISKYISTTMFRIRVKRSTWESGAWPASAIEVMIVRVIVMIVTVLKVMFKGLVLWQKFRYRWLTSNNQCSTVFFEFLKVQTFQEVLSWKKYFCLWDGAVFGSRGSLYSKIYIEDLVEWVGFPCNVPNIMLFRPPSVAAPASLQTLLAPSNATLLSSTRRRRSASWARRRSTRPTSRRAGWKSTSSSTLTDPFQSLLMAGIPPGDPGNLVLKAVLEARGREVRLTLRQSTVVWNLS